MDGLTTEHFQNKCTPIYISDEEMRSHTSTRGSHHCERNTPTWKNNLDNHFIYKCYTYVQGNVF